MQEIFFKKRVNIWTVSFRREFRLFKMFSLRFLWSCTGQWLVSQMRANFFPFSQNCLSLKHHWNYNCRSHFVHSDRCFKTTAQTVRIARTDGEKLDSKWWQSHMFSKLKLTFTKVSNFYIIFSHANICVKYVKYKLCVVTSHLKVRFA